MIAITKLLLSSQEVWVDELAATSDGSAMARWALLSALESALELRLTTPGAVVRLRVALPPSPDSRCAYGMYREQLHLHDGVPELPGPWQHDHTGPGFVLMHGLVDALAARLRLVLATRPNVPGTQFYWRATGTLGSEWGNVLSYGLVGKRDLDPSLRQFGSKLCSFLARYDVA